MFLKILKGKHSGQSINLELNRLYQLSNTFGYDLYIDFDFPESTQLEFTLHGREIHFSSAGEGFSINGSSKLNIDELYILPVQIACGETIFQIGEFSDLVESDEVIASVGDNIDAAFDEEFLSDNVSNTENKERPSSLIDFSKQLDSVGSEKEENNISISPLSLKAKLISWVKIIWEKIKSSWVYARIKNICLNLYHKNPLIFMISLGGVILLLMIIAIVSMNNLLDNNQSDFNQSILVEKKQLQKKINSLPKQFGHVKLAAEQNRLIVKGIVESTIQIRSIESIIASFPNSINQVKYFDEISPVIRKILVDHGLQSLKCGFDSYNGNVYLMGIIPFNKTLDDAIIDINNQLPMLFDIDNNLVFTQVEVESDVELIVKNKNYKSSIDGNFNYSKNTIQIYGYLPSNQIGNFSQQLEELKKKYKNFLKFDVDVQDIGRALPFKISEVYTGNPAYIVTSDGKILFPGGALNDITLVAIGNTQLIFQGKHRLVINLADIFSSRPFNSYTSLNNQNGRQKILQEEFESLNSTILKLESDLAGLKQLKEGINDTGKSEILTRHINIIQDELTELERAKKSLEGGMD